MMVKCVQTRPSFHLPQTNRRVERSSTMSAKELSMYCKLRLTLQAQEMRQRETIVGCRYLQCVPSGHAHTHLASCSIPRVIVVDTMILDTMQHTLAVLSSEQDARRLPDGSHFIVLTPFYKHIVPGLLLHYAVGQLNEPPCALGTF